MPSHDEAAPTPKQIERQLERMLASAVFVEAETQGRLLEHLVNKALAGEEVTEKTITSELFPLYEGRESGIVRVHKNYLRDRIEEYYEDDGTHDLVLISLPALLRKKGYKPPPGEAYRPLFKYNALHPVDQDYRRGMYYLAQCAPSDDDLALDYFAAALKREPGHAAAHAGQADVHLRRALYFHAYVTPAKCLAKTQEASEQALRCDPKLWRAHCIQGILHAFHRRWSKAQAAFDRGLECNETLTRYGAWYYPAFLMARGRESEALHLASERARDNPEDLPSQIVYGIFLYVACKFDDALFALALARTMNTRHWLTHTASALLALAKHEPATAHVILVHQVVGYDLFPGLLAFCLAEATRLASAPGEWGISHREAIGTPMAEIYAALDALADQLPTPPAQLAQMLEAVKSSYVSPLQLALAHMATDEPERAVTSLWVAMQDFYPLALWLAVLPVFDSLRNRSDFKKLLTIVRVKS